MAICILGMHRSGTSMITNLLYECGLYLGRRRDLMPPTEDNLRGYWENWRFVELNKKILAVAGGDWDRPPALPAHEWMAHPALVKLKSEAAKLIRDCGDHQPWGWKDPRTNFTIPFWRELIPGLKMVVCLRYPLEVEASLRVRRNSPHWLGLTVWRMHNQFLLDHTTPAEKNHHSL